MTAIIECHDLVRIFASRGVEVQALQGLDLVVQERELTAVVGASGSGKSTLLAILSGLDRPTAGRVRVGSHDVLTMRGRERLDYRRRVVGFVWQQTTRNLLPYLTAAENVTVPLVAAGMARRRRAPRVVELLDLLEIGPFADRRPDELSGGQQQRVAIAVALANRPEALLADEPTGELDEHNSEQVLDAFRTANDVLGTTVLIVTHDEGISGHVRRTVQIRDGRTSTETLRHTLTDEAGGERTVAREFAVLDRVGRMQLPHEYLTALQLRDRVELALGADHVRVTRADDTPPTPDPDVGASTEDER